MPVAATRAYHVNVNCSDLERSLGWYTETLGLTTLVRTTPGDPQPGEAFGLDVVQWDAWILQGAAGHSGVVLDVLQWHVPPPSGRARVIGNTGFVALVASAPQLPNAATPSDLVDGGYLVTDPDGTTVIVVEGEPAIAGLVVGCADVAASRRWYHQILGLALDDAGRPTDPERGFTFHLTEASPPPTGSPPPAKANQLGVFRTALLTSDIDADHEFLVAAGTTCFSPPVDLAMGPGLPALRALFFADPDRACVELIAPP